MQARYGFASGGGELSRLLGIAWLAAALVGPAAHAADGPVRLFVLREHGVSSATVAQPYLDKFVALAAAKNGWPGGQGSYLASRAAAAEFIRTAHPHYAILSLAAFLALRASHGLDPLGQVALSLPGGRRYALVSRDAADLAGCRGKPLASDHAADPRFVDRVVSGGAFALADFELVATRRPLQTIRALLDGQAVCALVDDAQLAELPKIPGAEGIRTVWTGAELPPMVVAAFPAASAEERETFRSNLVPLCDEEGKKICEEVGIVSLAPAAAADYAGVVAAYGG
jgi:hypothetical protein